MDKSKLELKVGVFVFVAIVVLAVFIFKISDLKNYGSGYPVIFVFNNVAGVKSGSPVRFAGVNVGEVRQVNIVGGNHQQGTQVEVVAWINKSLLIPQESQVFVSTLGLLGEKYIEIIPPDKIESFLAPGDRLRGTDPILMQDWIEEAQGIVKDFQEITQKLKSAEGTIGKLLYDDRLYQELEALISDLRRHPWKLFWKTRERR